MTVGETLYLPNSGFYGMSSQLKTVIDRLHTPKRNSFRVKGLILLAVGATTVPNLFDAVVTQYESTLKSSASMTTEESWWTA